MELWDGYVWRQSREVESTARLAYWITRSMGLRREKDGPPVSFEDVISEFPNYDGAWVRRELERMGYKGTKLERAMRKRGYLRDGALPQKG